jgi:hypothetical protein
MRKRPLKRFHPALERFEARQLLSGSAVTAHGANLSAGSRGQLSHAAETDAKSNHVPGSLHLKAGSGYFVYRLTNPTYRQINLKPPFLQTLVQTTQPVPGETYNVLFVVIKNGTSHTFTASDGLTARIPGTSAIPRANGQKGIPVLTGNEVWKPKQWLVLYVLGHKYYPLSPQVGAAFQLRAGGRSSTIVPGPSGIFLRLKYDPATFAQTLNWIVAYGQGAQQGAGSAVGMPDTAINTLVSAATRRIDFAGHF